MAELASTAQDPSRDFIRATPRNPILGYLSDLAGSSFSPERTQQMQSVAQFFGAPAISQTLNRMAYGEPLTTGAGGIGGTGKLRPEVAEAAMSVMDFLPTSGVAKGAAMAAPLAVGMLVGKKAATWDALAAAKAKMLADMGTDARMIWKETGTWKGPDGKWRQEIDSSPTIANQFNVVKRDASDIFGAGSEKVRYTDAISGGSIEVLKRPDNTASVLSLEVPKEFKGKGIGESLQAQVMQDFPAMMGQVSSKAAAKTAFRLGRRPPNHPDASLDDVFKLIDENSSVNLVSPKMQQIFNPAPSFVAPQDAALLEKSDLTEVRKINPFNAVEDVEKLNSLAASMQKNGWQGRPILAYDIGNGLEALTGSHRIAAAKKAGIEDIPVLKVSDEIANYTDDYGRSIRDVSDEDDIVEFLNGFGDKDAFNLMRIEQKYNANKQFIQD